MATVFKAQRKFHTLYWAAGIVFLSFLLTVAVVVELASRQADKFALESEVKLVRMEFERQRTDLRSSLGNTAHWDDAVQYFATPNGPTKAKLESILEDGDILYEGEETFAVVTPKDDVSFAVLNASDNYEYKVAMAPGKLPFVRDNFDLVKEARERYLSKRRSAGDKFVVDIPKNQEVADIYASAIREVDGEASLLMAQVIIPETDEFALDDQQIYVAMASYPFTKEELTELGQLLGLKEPAFAKTGGNEIPISNFELFNASRTPELTFTWKSNPPRPEILKAVTPVGALLLTLILALLAYMLRKHTNALKALGEREHQLQAMATSDALTGLHNRLSFDSELNKSMESHTFALMTIDLDHFKAVNDTHGHAAGDAVLIEVARRFKERVGGKGMIARVGGDEFIAIVKSNVSRDELQQLGDGLIRDASRPVPFANIDLQIGASIGVAIWPEHGRTAHELMAMADAVLYEAKRSGRGRTSFRGAKAEDAAAQIRSVA
ncbi:MAG: diguanylate cyclase domain-containing protein [Rhizobiaceae bacterium]